MIKVNRSVRIEWRNNPSSFELRNKDAFKTDFLRLGSAIRPVNELLSRSEEMRVLLPTVVGVSPIDSSWQERITTYLNDFLLEIPVHGLEFDTSYVLDLGNPALKSNIDELIGKLKKADNSDWIWKERFSYILFSRSYGHNSFGASEIDSFKMVAGI